MELWLDTIDRDYIIEAKKLLPMTGVTTMATAIYEPSQIILSGLAGANYTAPYIGRISEQQDGYLKILSDMLAIIYIEDFPLKIIAAALRTKQQCIDCFRLGVPAVTLSKEVFDEMTAESPLTELSVMEFQQRWKSRVC